jgi:hypothetical protein
MSAAISQVVGGEGIDISAQISLWKACHPELVEGSVQSAFYLGLKTKDSRETGLRKASNCSLDKLPAMGL